MSGLSHGPEGCLDTLRDGYVAGWARDLSEPNLVTLIRVMRGGNLLAEGRADGARPDGLPGFRIRLPRMLRPDEILDGRVRVHAFLPGRQAATTLTLTPALRSELEAAAGHHPANHPALPPAAGPSAAPMTKRPNPAEPPPSLRRPLLLPVRPAPRRSPDAPPAAPVPVKPEGPAAAGSPNAPPAREVAVPALDLEKALPDLTVHETPASPRAAVARLAGLAAIAAAQGVALLHLLPAGGPALAAAAAEPALAKDLLPLQDGTADGAASMRSLLSALYARRLAEPAALARAEALVAAGTFTGLAPPRLLSERPGLQAWHSPNAPLPVRVLLLTRPGLGGGGQPTALGWWLRWLAAESVLSEALGTAPDAAALALHPDLIVTLLPGGQAAEAAAPDVFAEAAGARAGATTGA